MILARIEFCGVPAGMEPEVSHAFRFVTSALVPIEAMIRDFDFCDIGNGVYDSAEFCRDGSENCNSSQLYEMSDRPNSLVVSYENDSPEPFLVILPGQSIQNRWGLPYDSLIETIDFSDTQFESVTLIDSIVTVYSNPIIQQLDLDSPTDYYIAKSVWNDGGREYDYHMFRQGDEVIFIGWPIEAIFYLLDFMAPTMKGASGLKMMPLKMFIYTLLMVT